MYMTQIALAKEMGVSRQYVNGILASKYHTQAQRTKVVTALESFARSRGLKLSDLWCPEPHAQNAQILRFKGGLTNLFIEEVNIPMFDKIPDFINPDYVAEKTYEERYAEEEESMFEEPWAVYDPD